MAIFKCKICGGSLEIDTTQSVATCEYCGTKQTLPKLDNERRANLYDRANHFRRNNDFDKAMGIYESILNEDNTDAEAYWSLVLCRYGIEYVEDPATHKRVPTVNRAQFTSIFDDEDYKSAIANADGYQCEIYEAEATTINEIQRGILAVSQKEEPFDVFVCYKETDASGRRTQDSVLATELYHELTREGFKVFFSRITLEDKLGVAYEPYIFAALHSAKVMVVLGTRSEHFNAVWVKNEWSRFLALIKNGAKKTLIPAYRDMDPYDLPEEFSHLQAQDMSKLGFMQDLTRGIEKIVEAEATKASGKETIEATATTLNVAPLLKRAFMFLEDGDFDRADEFCEQVLNQDPENAQAYLGKLMAEFGVKKQEDLKNCVHPFDDRGNYQKAIRFADTTLTTALEEYIKIIKDRNARKTEEINKELLYSKALNEYASYDIARLRSAIKLFASVEGYKDSAEYTHLCQEKINQVLIEKKAAYVEAERKKKRNKKIASIIVPMLAIVIAFCIIMNCVIVPNKKYGQALAFMNNGKYEEAILVFEELNGYKDSNQRRDECKYQNAIALMNNNKILKALFVFMSLGSYKDSQQRAYSIARNYGFIETISSGDNRALALQSDGTVLMGGYVGMEEEEVLSTWTGIISIAAGPGHIVGLKSDGSVVRAGCGYSIDGTEIAWRDIFAISAGEKHTVGLKFDGTVVAKGWNNAGQCDVNTWQNIVSISAGGYCTVGLKTDGTVIVAGDVDYDDTDLNVWRDIIAVSAGSGHIVGLKANGTVLAIGEDKCGETNVDEWQDIVAISAGYDHTVGLKSDGTVVAVGQNYDGRCNVSEWRDIVAISAGEGHTIGVKSDGTVVIVGDVNLWDVSHWKDLMVLDREQLKE